MPFLHLVAWFLGGAFLANAVPHFVMGTIGRPFPTPFLGSFDCDILSPSAV